MRNLGILLLSVLLVSACNTQKRLKAKEHKYMESAYVDIKSSIPEAEVIILNDTIKVLFPENLLFTIGKAEVNEANYPLLERFSKSLNKYDKSSILITGYTDNSGTEQLNDVLSKNRAISVKEILLKNQVSKERLYTWGRGMRNPIAENKTLEGRRKNRRVEFIILYNYSGEKVKE